MRNWLVIRDRIAWISVEDRWKVYRRDNFTCQICGMLVNLRHIPSSPDAPTLDHIVPRSEGGSDNLENLRLACRRCNSWRGNRLPANARREPTPYRWDF